MKLIDLLKHLLLWISLFVILPACQAPTPPPSPTPWPTVMATITAAGTKATTPKPTNTPTPTLKPVSLPTAALTQIVVWESLPEAQAEALARDIDTFQEKFPQFIVTQQHYDSPESFMTSLAAGEISFDAVLASPVLLGSLWAGQQIAPMSDFFPPSFIDNFASVTLTGASRDQKLWGLPDTAGFHLLLFYNRDLVDTPPSDTNQLFELAQSLTRPDREPSQWGLGVNSYDPLWLTPWLNAYGDWLTDAGGQPTLDTPGMAAALELHLGWHGLANRPGNKKSTQVELAPLASYEEVRTRFLQGDMAMVIDGEWAIVELARTEAIDWGVAPLPAVSQAEESQSAGPLVLARYWAVNRSVNGDRALAVAALLEYLTRPERQLAWTTQFGLLPTRRQALEDPLIANDPALRVSAAQMRGGRGIVLGTSADTLLNAMRQPLEAALNGELTPAEAAEMMQRNVN